MASTTPHEAETSFFSSLTSFFLPTAHAEGPVREIDGDGGDDAQDKEEGGEKEEEEEAEEGGEEADEEEEEEEEEPEDESECNKPAEHFKHCSDKVEAGKGWHGEDCVEELFHLMHCVDSCAAPKVFKKLA